MDSYCGLRSLRIGSLTQSGSAWIVEMRAALAAVAGDRVANSAMVVAQPPTWPAASMAPRTRPSEATSSPPLPVRTRSASWAVAISVDLGDEIPDRVCHRCGGDGHVTPEVLDGGDSGFEVDVGERLGRSGLGDDVGLVRR